MFRIVAGALISALALGGGSAAALTVVTSEAEFEAAIGFGPTVTYEFPINTSNATLLDFGAFETEMQNSDASTIHGVTGERLLFQLDAEGTGVDTSLVMSFDAPIFGVGFTADGFDFIEISVDGGAVFTDVGGAIAPAPSGFFGLVADETFDTVIFDIPVGDPGDGAFLDDLIYTTGPLPPGPPPRPTGEVPVPASLPLLAVAAAALAGLRRWSARRPG
ncbi:MAG: hypothetical protein AAFU61_06995 [Pseudomonadota bacterium]